MSAEKTLGTFLDKYFYQELSKKNPMISCQRQFNRDMQMSGADVVITSPDKRMVIDEKAAIYYSNAMIPTFAFEVSSIQRQEGTPCMGWFLNDELLTEYYLLVWVNIKCKLDKSIGKWVRKDLGELCMYDFTLLEAYLIRKYAIRDYLAKHGWEKQDILALASRIRLQESTKTDVGQEDFRFVFSPQIAEKPLNIVISKPRLFELSERAYLISTTGVAELKGRPG